MLDFKQLALDISDDLTTLRHHFHKHPELSYYEYNTTEKIVETLKEIGYQDIKVGSKIFPKTGVIVDLNPGKPGPCMLLRADIDALPIVEQTEGLDYKSENDGVMHACGHDAHITMLLGVARVLYGIKDQINGNVRFLFQPGEETGSPEEKPRASAAILIKETNVMDGVDAVMATHVWGTLPVGKFCYRAGALMATNAAVSLTINGKGGHGAMPHTTIDPVPVACEIVSAWQTIVSRIVNPLETAVLTVGKIQAEGAWNIIPPKVVLTGGLRALSDDVLHTMLEKIETMGVGIATAMGCTAEFSYVQTCATVLNDKELNDEAVESIKKTLGEDSVMEIPPVMPSEDFSLYQKVVPGVMLFLGVGDDAYAQHHPKYNVDDSVLPIGVAGIASATYDFINVNHKK